MITIEATDEEITEVLESVHRSLNVYMGRVKNGDKVAARKWRLLSAFRDGIIESQLDTVEGVEAS